MTREIETFQIPPIAPEQVPAFLNDHFAVKPRLEFRIKDLTPVASFAVGYFFDAMQEVLDKSMLGDARIDVLLDSGWSARTVDIGHLWKRHIEFTSPSDPTRGFVLEGKLDMVETENDDVSDYSSNAFIEKLMAGFKAQKDLVKSNSSSPEFRPENSVRIDEYSVFPFGGSDRWYEHQKTDVYKSLLNSTYVSEAFEYRPQSPQKDGMFDVEHSTRSITEPGEAIASLTVISELAAKLAPTHFREAMRKHSSAVYGTLVEENVSLLLAVRGTLSDEERFPSSSLTKFFDHFWRSAACEDILRNLHFVTESGEALIEMGHTSPGDRFDCNDGRTRAYATTDGDAVSVYSQWEEWSTLVKIHDDRVAVYKCDFHSGDILQTVVDFEHRDGEVLQINEICAYDDLTAGVMTRSLVDLSSVHCYVVTDRQAPNGGGSLRP